MEKQSRFILIYFVFLIFAYVDTINCILLNLTDPNVCPRKVTTRSDSVSKTQLILECCPDYVYKNGKCQVCPAGIFGRHCLLSCMPNYYGLQCKNVCNCKDFKKCNPVHGCVCDEGFTGKECLNTCPAGTYGVNCAEECVCGENAKCDPITGDCLCSAGWFGDQCTKVCKAGTYGLNCDGECFCAHGAECNHVTGGCLCPAGRFGRHCTADCPIGKFGGNCSGICACSDVEKCDFVTGECIQSHKDEANNLHSGQNINKLNDNVIVYITMVAALIGIVCVVTMVVKVKERLCRQLQQSLKDTSKPKIKRRKAKRSLPLTHTQNEQTGSYIINTESVMSQSEIEEDLYCEIGDINEVESDRY